MSKPLPMLNRSQIRERELRADRAVARERRENRILTVILGLALAYFMFHLIYATGRGTHWPDQRPGDAIVQFVDYLIHGMEVQTADLAHRNQ